MASRIPSWAIHREARIGLKYDRHTNLKEGQILGRAIEIRN
jgi:hypothetical protein